MSLRKQYFACIVILALFITTIALILTYSDFFKSLIISNQRDQPNIIVIIADDMGWNDVGFHGSNQIPTPNIDALAYNGIVLDRFYTQSTCTPSRAAFLTGNYPIRSGMHGYPMMAGENRSLPDGTPTMAELLRSLGYRTHLIGKWHLGAAFKSSTPTGRGFDSHYGYWNGFVGYYDYVSFRYGDNSSKIMGYDLHDDFDTDWDSKGLYATHLFRDRAVEVLENHDVEKPLFLVLSHLAPHTGKNGVELEVPDENLTNHKYSYIKDSRRRAYADVVNLMDDTVGKIVSKLEEKNMLENAIILFFSDNGAQTVGMYENSGSNWPLRGLKFTEFEGGVRCPAAIFSPLFEKRGYVNKQLIHLSDWLPTFYTAAGGNVITLGEIDGIDQWESLTSNITNKRTEILLNIDEVDNTSAIITNRGRYKYLRGTYNNSLFDKYFGESGRNSNIKYNVISIINSETNLAMKKHGFNITEEVIRQIRNKSDLSWCKNDSYEPLINCTSGCVFDLEKDPCETTNIIKERPEVAVRLSKKLERYSQEIVPQKNRESDPNSDPLRYNNTWCTWLDDDHCVKTPNLKIRIK